MVRSLKQSLLSQKESKFDCSRDVPRDALLKPCLVFIFLSVTDAFRRVMLSLLDVFLPSTSRLLPTSFHSAAPVFYSSVTRSLPPGRCHLVPSSFPVCFYNTRLVFISWGTGLLHFPFPKFHGSSGPFCLTTEIWSYGVQVNFQCWAALHSSVAFCIALSPFKKEYTFCRLLPFGTAPNLLTLPCFPLFFFLSMVSDWFGSGVCDFVGPRTHRGHFSSRSCVPSPSLSASRRFNCLLPS